MSYLLLYCILCFNWLCLRRAEEETIRTAFERAGVAGGTVDFEALKSLTDDGIDMSFVDNLQKQYAESQVCLSVCIMTLRL
jgi:hypothetical protein